MHGHTDSASLDLLSSLKALWGYDAFRAKQQAVIHSILSGRDACVIMPTGGGKSLCYQLPAQLLGKTAVVISPLIALMQDQVAGLQQIGVSAAALNSTQSPAERSLVMTRAREGAYRLLYVSPERIGVPSTVEFLKQVPLSFFVIDEAHCISEWGHEFRPEYRTLNSLRASFPALPIAAFTASATRAVRQDILTQLQLRDPDKYIASFHRSNLRYVAQLCTTEEDQFGVLRRALKHHAGKSVIVYAPTIKRVEEVAQRLKEAGIGAIAYHGKMDAEVRRRNQERWTSDEVSVAVATVAFGLGINKAAVRAVIHLALPKSIEHYYQESGRAGRDDAPADCVLLWRRQDGLLLDYFARQFSDEAERGRALQRSHVMQAFAERPGCRHRTLCLHFGETPKWESCGTCDSCGVELDWLPSTAQRFTPDAPPVKRPKPSYASAVHAGAPEANSNQNEELMECLRAWRRGAAKKHSVPAFSVMHDTTLEAICRRRPRWFYELRAVPGIGERKLQMYGTELLAVVEEHRQEVPNQRKPAV